MLLFNENHETIINVTLLFNIRFFKFISKNELYDVCLLNKIHFANSKNVIIDVFFAQHIFFDVIKFTMIVNCSSLTIFDVDFDVFLTK